MQPLDQKIAAAGDAQTGRARLAETAIAFVPAALVRVKKKDLAIGVEKVGRA